ncbi:hypothetical protein D3C72_2587250 [compost metagenome]
MLTVLAHQAQNQAHDKHHGIQRVGGLQRGVWAAVSHNRAGDYEGQHGADGAAGQYEVNQFWRSDFGLQ